MPDNTGMEHSDNSFNPAANPGQATISVDEHSLVGGLHGTIIARDANGNIIGSIQGYGTGPFGFSGTLTDGLTQDGRQPVNTSPSDPSRTYFAGTQDQVNAMMAAGKYAADQVARMGLGYDLSGPNSNTVLSSALNAMGTPLQGPVVGQGFGFVGQDALGIPGTFSGIGVETQQRVRQLEPTDVYAVSWRMCHKPRGCPVPTSSLWGCVGRGTAS